ncbi:MAG: hypothetical protein AAFY50_11675, partial [Cyanobacteria bacterium J06648_1]
MLDSRSLAASLIPQNQSVGHKQQVWQLVAKRTLKSIPQRKIMFVGSSIFRLWKTLESDMYPLPV